MSETRRDAQKLWLILFQIKGARSRINFLALQRWIFAALAIVIGAIGLTFFAAASFGPLTFLGVAIFLLIAAIAGLVRETIVVRKTRANPMQAAEIADARSQMKGRLATVLALAENPKRSPLWAYLVEDTYDRREEFEPARVSPRWLSRAIYLLLAAILLAGLALPAAHLGHSLQRSLATYRGRGPNQVTADINNLEIHAADPALKANAEIYADPETLKKLADKLAAAQNSERHQDRLSKMVDRARKLADAFQHKLNGLDQSTSNKIRMRLTDRNPGAPGKPNKPANHAGKPATGESGAAGSGLADNSRREAAGRSRPGAAGGAPPMTSIPPDQADQLASKNPSAPPGTGASQGPGGGDNPADASDPNSGGGSSHGAGGDPATLLGPASAQPLGSESFKIAIDAEPSDESSTPGSPTYVPPRIRVPLNSKQYPDQPLARTAVPAADQNTIKRVFDR